MLVGMRTHHRIVSAYGTKGLTRMVTWRQARFVRTTCWESLLLAQSRRRSLGATMSAYDPKQTFVFLDFTKMSPSGVDPRGFP